MPKHIPALVAMYFVASLAHFAHNAEYIAFYPGMPPWLTREGVYMAWLAITCVGVAGLVLLLASAMASGTAQQRSHPVS